MKKYIVGNDTTSYSVESKGRINLIVPKRNTFLQSGRGFTGRLVFVRTPNGFQPMVKVANVKNGGVYYYPNQVTLVDKGTDKFAIPRAGEIGGVRNNPYSVEAGVVEGDMNTAPSVGEMMSGANGNAKPMAWGVQAGQVANTNPSAGRNPMQVMGGEIEGVHETVSHEYKSNANGVMGINAGESFDWATLSQPVNPYGLEAGVIEGDRETAPQVFSYANGGDSFGYNNADRFPQMEHYTQARVNVSPELVDYSDSVFSGFNSGLQAGQSFNYGTKGQPINPYGVEAGFIEGENTAPESYSYADAKELTEEEMEALHKDTAPKKNFWDWLKTDQAKGLASDSVGIAKSLWNQKQQEKLDRESGGGSTLPTYTPPSGVGSGGAKPDNDKKILWMHPLTFGIVTGVVVLGVITTILLVRKGK